MKTLVLGGTRSGKSRLAEQLAEHSGFRVTYIATARVSDDEMKQRVEIHRQRRPADWQIIEEPIALADALRQQADDSCCLLIDCLTLWLTNLLIDEDPHLFEQQKNLLLKSVPQLPGNIIFVSNETNMGITPMGELSRRFCDEAGLLHQQIAECSDRVILTVAGLPQVLKGEKL